MFKLNIKTTVGGREVRPEDFGKEFAKAAEEEILGRVSDRITSVRCAVHHRAPTNVRMRKNGTKVEWAYEVCCPLLKKKVEAAFQG